MREGVPRTDLAGEQLGEDEPQRRAREEDASARRKKKAMGSGESELLAHPGHHIYSPLDFDLGVKR